MTVFISLSPFPDTETFSQRSVPLSLQLQRQGSERLRHLQDVPPLLRLRRGHVRKGLQGKPSPSLGLLLCLATTAPVLQGARADGESDCALKVNTVLNIHKPRGLLGTGRKGGRGYGGGGRGRLYTYRCTVTTRMTSALRWAAMRAILMFHNCEGQSVHRPQLVKRKESRSGFEPMSLRLPA